MTSSASVHFRLPIQYEKRQKWYVASCPILDVVSQGDTKHKAKANLREALIAFLETCIEIGSIGDVLAECGFKPVSKRSSGRPKQKTKRTDANPEEFVNVPIELLINKRSCHNQCHA
jgi:predicted RNase H-like HicB family nuclease